MRKDEILKEIKNLVQKVVTTEQVEYHSYGPNIIWCDINYDMKNVKVIED